MPRHPRGELSANLKVLMTVNQKEMIQALAWKYHLTASEYLRMLADDDAIANGYDPETGLKKDEATA